jgi:hypothetical protein
MEEAGQERKLRLHKGKRERMKQLHEKFVRVKGLR